MTAIMPTIGFCHIIQRDPADCTYIGFRRACARFREKLYQKTGVRLDQPCNPRPEVQQLSEQQPQQQEKIAMASSKKSKLGKCSACGQKRELVKHFEKDVCSPCRNFRSAIKNKPEIAIATLAEFGLLPKQDKAAATAQSETVEELKNQVEKLKADLAEYIGLVDEYRKREKLPVLCPDAELVAENATLKDRLLAYEKSQAELVLENDILKKNATSQQSFDIGQLNVMVQKVTDAFLEGRLDGITLSIVPRIAMAMERAA